MILLVVVGCTIETSLTAQWISDSEKKINSKLEKVPAKNIPVLSGSPVNDEKSESEK